MISPRHLLVDRVHVGVEVAQQRLLPEARVDEVGPLAVELRLEVVLVDRADQLLQLAVRRQDHRRRRHLVDVAHLQADDPVLDVIDDADAVAPGDLGDAIDQLDQAEPLAVERHRDPPLELQRRCPAIRRAHPWAASRSRRRRPAAARSSPRSARPPRSDPRCCRRPNREGPPCLPLSGCRARARRRSPPRGPSASRARERSPSSRDRAPRPSPRSAPGRCPCRCSRGRSCRSRTRSPARRRAWRSAAGRAP